MAERRVMSFSLANLILVVTWVSVVLAIQAMWGRETLPYTMAFSWGIVGVLIRKWIFAGAPPGKYQVINSFAMFAMLGSFFGRGLQYADGAHDLRMAAIQFVFALSGVFWLFVVIKIRNARNACSAGERPTEK